MNFSSGGPHPAVPELFHTLISLSDEWLRSSTLGHLSVTWKKEDCGGSEVVVQSLSHVRLFATPWTAACQASLSSIISQSLLKFMFISQWYHPTISSSTAHCSYCHQSSPASGSFPLSQLFVSGGQSIRALASVFLMNIHCWFPLGLTGLMSLLSKGFSNTTIQNHQLFGPQPSLWSNSHICTWLLEKP